MVGDLQATNSEFIDVSTQQKARIYRIATTGAGIFVHLVVCALLLSIGYPEFGHLQLFAVGVLAELGFLIFIVAILMEWNLSLQDPDMSLPHMLWAVSIIVVTTSFSTEMKYAVALSGLAMIVAGANRLSPRELWMFALYGLIAYIASVFIKAQFVMISWPAEAVGAAAFGLVLVCSPVLYRLEMTKIQSILVNKNEELTTALDRIQELAVRDELTGVFNRRHLMEFLSQQKALADRRGDYSFTLCYVDLDHFKRVNDRFGHHAGDDVLCNVANIASGILREVDCVARIGGEEFVLVLGGTSERDAMVVAERLSVGISQMRVSAIDPRYRVTASMGITGYRRIEELESAMERADRALYDAKREGRNRVVIAGSTGDPRVD